MRICSPRLPAMIMIMMFMVSGLLLNGQIKEITFGQIPVEELEMAEYAPDPSADAVMLENHASSRVQLHEGIRVLTFCHVRIRINNTEGLHHANLELPYRSDESISGLKAASYNLEEGKVVQTQVDKKNIQYEETSRYRNTIRISFPDVRVGTVIEFRYTLTSPDYFSLYTFWFQQEIPVRRCKFQVEFPDFLEYKMVSGGQLNNIVFRREERWMSWGRSQVSGVYATWSGYNLPAFKSEPFGTGAADFYSHIGFELSKIEIPGYYFNQISPTYDKLSDKLLDRDDFGGYLNRSAVVRKVAEQLSAEGGSETDVVRRISSYVAGYMMWNGVYDYTASAAMTKVYNNARGNSADINLMLVAMLRHAGIKADPVILSTRRNGRINQFFAIMSRFNNVVAAVTVYGERWLIDATDPLNPFNMLPVQCLNGQGWLVTVGGGSWVDLTNGEQYNESLALEMELDENGGMRGRAINRYSSYDARRIRGICRLQGEAAYTDLRQAEESHWKIGSLVLGGLDDPEGPVTETIDMTISSECPSADGVIYLNPILTGRIESNDFYADERLSPIDLACPDVRHYQCTITIPEGWRVAELPQSVSLRLEGGGALFRYDIMAEGGVLKLDTEISFTTVLFSPQRYETIRNFWSTVIRKQAEVVVLTKEI